MAFNLSPLQSNSYLTAWQNYTGKYWEKQQSMITIIQNGIKLFLSISAVCLSLQEILQKRHENVFYCNMPYFSVGMQDLRLEINYDSSPRIN